MLRQWALLVVYDTRLRLRSVWTRGLIMLAVISAALSAVAGSAAVERRRGDADVVLARLVVDRENGQRRLSGLAPDPALRAVRRSPPTFALVRGSDATAPQSWDFTPAGLVPGRSTVTDDLVQQLDVEAVVRVVLGLMLLLGSAARVIADRSTSLKAFATLRVPTRLVLLAHLSGGSVVGTFAAAVTVGAGVSACAMVMPDAVTPELVGTAVWLVVAASLYSGVVVGLGTLVGAFARPEYTAPVALGVWFLVTLAAPAGIRLSDQIRNPPVPWTAHESHRAELYRSLSRESEERLGRELRAAIGAHGEVREVAATSPIWNELATKASADARRIRTALIRLDQEVGESRTPRTGRQSLRWLDLVTPGSLHLEAAAALSGTGRGAIQAVHDRAQSLQRWIEDRLFDSRRRLRLLVPGSRGTSLEIVDRELPPTVASLEIPTVLQTPVPPTAGSALASLLGLGAHLVLAWLAVVILAPRGLLRRHQSSAASSTMP